MVKIVVLASFNMDLVMRADWRPESGETLRGEFAMHLGGKGFNQAVAARRLGADVTVIGRMGDDEFGRMFLDALDAEGIDRRFVAVDPHEGTGVASITVEPDGTNTIVQAPRANLGEFPDDEMEKIIEDLKQSGVDVALSQLETSLHSLSAFLHYCELFGIPLVIFNAAPAVPFPVGFQGEVDVLIANDSEAAAITRRTVQSVDDARLAAKAITRLAPWTAIVTLGSQGAVFHASDESNHATAFAVDVVDTTGAGDAFCGAFAVRRGEGAALRDAVRFANAAGALACTQHGAYPSMPRRDAVEALLAKGERR